MRHQRVEHALARALSAATGSDTPPRLAQALHDAVFPGGGRVRPALVLAVSEACGGTTIPVADAVAVAVELMHCASLVHDDLPCFDDAATRRGRPSVHRVHGEALAVLAGDALIIAAFETLAEGCRLSPQLLGPLVRAVGAGVNARQGIVAGQAWESEPQPDLVAYHCAKTGALFEAAVAAGAIVGGGERDAWAGLGMMLGEAYQVADDIADAISTEAILGKPVGQDRAHQRPSAVHSLGLDGAFARLDSLHAEILAAVPQCADPARFEDWVEHTWARLRTAVDALRTVRAASA